ncbi:hypothetical protein BDF22DRAFT_657116 [Syncephalis plumigaleata]|nr:hypothetical protein BDF22DRAFT_657116 [Syncephalis plumigaleata]
MPDTTTTTSPALPEGSILDAIRTSCTRVLDRYLTNQEYDLSGVETYLNELNSDESRVDTAMVEARRKNTPATLPLRFEQLEDELTVYALLELSQEVLSSHSSIIQSMTERTAEDIALFGTMSLYIGDQQLTTQRISNISASDISSYFGLPLQREVPHPTMSFVTIGERAPTWDCVMSLRQLFSNLAAKLQTSGFSSLGEAVKAAAEHAKDYAIANNNGANDPVTISVDRFIYELCTRVDAFNDAAILHGED